MRKYQSMQQALVHSDRELNSTAGAIRTPVYQSVLIGYQNTQDLVDIFQGKQAGHVYARQSTPSTLSLEKQIAYLEGGKAALCFSSGMAAISAIFLTLLKSGDHIVASQFLFGNTASLFGTLENFGITVSRVDVTDASNVKNAITADTKMVFTEVIANPVTQIADLAKINTICREANLPWIIDNTMTPCNIFDGVAQGASLLVSSLTKSYAGHGTVTAGVVVETGNFNWLDYPNILEGMRKLPVEQQAITQIKKKGLRDMGGCLSSDSASLVSQGAETLMLRMDKACANALAIAQFLSEHPKVNKVYYPGLESHPQHKLAKSLLQNFGAILSFDLDESIDPVYFLDQLSSVISATHLGDNRTLALPVAQTIYFEMGQENRMKAGLSENMIRMSVGIEDANTIINEIAEVLA